MQTFILFSLLTFSSPVDNEGILFAGFTKIGKEEDLQSTVPYRVLRNWKSKTVTKGFVAGDNSPELDKQATYLYLYQPGNDASSAGKFEEFYIRLKSSKTLITSWGHFELDLRNKSDNSKVPHSEFAPANASDGIVFVGLDEKANRASPSETELGPNFFRVKYDNPVEVGNKVKTVGFTSNQPPVMSDIQYESSLTGSVPVPREIPTALPSFIEPRGDLSSNSFSPNSTAYTPNIPGAGQLAQMSGGAGMGSGLMGGSNRGGGRVFTPNQDTNTAKEIVKNNEKTVRIVEKCCEDAPIVPAPASWTMGIIGLLSWLLFYRQFPASR